MPKKKSEGKPGSTRNKTERETQRAELPKLLRRGWTQAMIAEKFGVSQAQVSCDYKIVMKELRQEASEDIKELIGLKLEEYGEVKKEMWEAWEKSKKNQEERLEEDVSSDRGGHTKTAVKEKGSCGDPKFIAIVMECIKQECNLLALNPAKEIRGSLTTSINWDVLSQGIPLNGPVPDEIENEVRRLLGYTDSSPTVAPDDNTIVVQPVPKDEAEDTSRS